MKNKILDAIYFIHNEGIINDDDLEFLLLNFPRIKERYSEGIDSISDWNQFVNYAWIWDFTTNSNRMRMINANCNVKFKRDRFEQFQKRFSIKQSES